MLLKFNSVKEYFVSEDRYSHGLQKLPFVVWSRLFYDLKGCLTLSRSNDSIVVKFVHQVFYRAFATEYNDYCQKAKNELIKYYLNQDNYINDKRRPNIRKAYSLTTLLKSNGDIKRLSQLYNDLSFVDSVIKIGNVEEAISTTRYLIENENDPDFANIFKKVLLCLQNNRNTLNCYYENFYSCAYETGLVSDVKPIISRAVVTSNNTSYFPYGTDSSVVWSSDVKRYAVYNRSYVYICECQTGSELCRIYLEPSDAFERTIVDNVIWLDSSRIAVATEKDKILIYDFCDLVPNVINQFEYDGECKCIKYNDAEKALLFIKDDAIVCVNPFDAKEYYSVPLKKANNLFFDINPSENELIIKKKVKTISVYDLTNGKIKKQVPVKAHNNYSESFISMGISDSYRILKINDTCYFEYTSFDMLGYIKFAVYDTERNTSTFLHPPVIKPRSELIVGKKSFLLIFDDVLLYVELDKKYEMKYYSIPNVNDVSWYRTDEVISVVCSDGLKLINVSDFSRFEEEMRYCFCSKKNLYTLLSYNGEYAGFAFGGFAKLVNSLYKLLGNTSRVLEYKYLFSEFLKILESKDSNIASIITYAANGSSAVAYEGESAIAVFDKDGKQKLIIDKLKLSLIDNILKLEFSPDSKKLLLWTNRFARVIDTDRGKCIVKIDLTRRPAFDVAFGEDSTQLKIHLCDDKHYIYSLKKRKKGKLPKKLVDRKSKAYDNYVSAYSVCNCSGTVKVFSMINGDDFELNSTPRNWFTNTRAYYNDEQSWLLFEGGEFYLNGDRNKIFSHENTDFNKSINAERLHDPTPLRTYLREKNDLFSILTEKDNHYLILISRMMNSVIVFDTNQMKVIAAYKHADNIIGCKFIDTDTIELISDKSPYTARINIALP